MSTNSRAITISDSEDEVDYTPATPPPSPPPHAQIPFGFVDLPLPPMGGGNHHNGWIFESSSSSSSSSTSSDESTPHDSPRDSSSEGSVNQATPPDTPPHPSDDTQHLGDSVPLSPSFIEPPLIRPPSPTSVLDPMAFEEVIIPEGTEGFRRRIPVLAVPPTVPSFRPYRLRIGGPIRMLTPRKRVIPPPVPPPTIAPTPDITHPSPTSDDLAPPAPKRCKRIPRQYQWPTHTVDRWRAELGIPSTWEIGETSQAPHETSEQVMPVVIARIDQQDDELGEIHAELERLPTQDTVRSLEDRIQTLERSLFILQEQHTQAETARAETDQLILDCVQSAEQARDMMEDAERRARSATRRMESFEDRAAHALALVVVFVWIIATAFRTGSITRLV